MSLVERGSVSIGETDWQACYYHECAEVRTKVYTGPGTSRDGVIKTGWELRQKVSKLSGFFFFFNVGSICLVARWTHKTFLASTISCIRHKGL